MKAGQMFQIGVIFNSESNADLIKITVKNISKELINPPKYDPLPQVENQKPSSDGSGDEGGNDYEEGVWHEDHSVNENEKYIDKNQRSRGDTIDIDGVQTDSII